MRNVIMFIGLCGAASSALAESGDKSSFLANANATESRALDLLLATADSPAPVPQSNVIIALQAGSGDGEASLQLAFGRKNPCRMLANDDAVCEERAFIITASSPLGKGQTRAFATLDRLAGGQKVRLTWSSLSSRYNFGTYQRNKNHWLDKIHAGCLAQAMNSSSATEAAAGCDRQRNEERIDDSTLTFLTDQDRRAYNRASFENSLSNRWGYALNAAASYLDFSHFDRSRFADGSTEDFLKANSRRVAISAGGAVSFFPFPGGALTLSSEYQRAFKADKSQIICPVVAAATVRCTEGSFAPPIREQAAINRVELRVRGGSGQGLLAHWAIAPSVSHDAISDEVAIDVPLYLVPDKEGELIGGLRFGWTTREKAVFGVFVGTRFSLFQ